MATSSNPIMTELVDVALAKFPEAQSRTIARKLATENPEIGTAEQFRSAIRVRRGAHGERHRQQCEKNRVPNPGPTPPKSDSIKRVPYEIPKDRSHVLALFDIHYPYQDDEALQAAVVWAKDHPIDTLILGGDAIDCYEVSRFMKDPRKRRLKEELSGFVELMRYFDYHFPGALKIWKQGNHEERWCRYLMNQAPVVWDVMALDLPEILSVAYGYDLTAEGWIWAPNKQIIQAGKLSIIHGHEMPGNATVNIARGRFLKTYDNVMAGHSHRKNDDVVKNINGHFYGSFSVGCLCDLSPDYMPINQWTHGFAYIKLAEDGGFRVSNLQIIEGRVM